MAFSEYNYLYGYGEPKFYACELNRFSEEAFKQKYVDFVMGCSNFDAKFKEYVKSGKNVTLAYKWDFAVWANCTSIELGYSYKSSYYRTTGYYGEIDNSNITINESQELSSYESTQRELFLDDYILETGIWGKTPKSLRDVRDYIVNAKALKGPQIGYENYDFKKDSFIEMVFNNSNTEDLFLELEKRVQKYGDKYKNGWFKSCRVNKMKVFLFHFIKFK